VCATFFVKFTHAVREPVHKNWCGPLPNWVEHLYISNIGPCLLLHPTVPFPHRQEGSTTPNVAGRNCAYSTLLHVLLYSDHRVGWSSTSLYIPMIIYLQNYHFEWPCFAGWIMPYVPLPHNTGPCCRWTCGAGAGTCSTDQRPIKIASPVIRFHCFKKKALF
jgi:hypothetical protein